MKWFELDVSWMTIWAFEKLGLAWDVVRPKPKVIEHPPAEEPRAAV